MTAASRRPGRDQRGQALSSFVAVVLVALFGVAGLVIDGGAQSAARAEAESVAAHAARAAVDASARSRAAGRGADAGAAEAAARQVLTDRAMPGEVVVEAARVSVTTRTTTRTVFLSLIGITALPASGDATAVLEA